MSYDVHMTVNITITDFLDAMKFGEEVPSQTFQGKWLPPCSEQKKSSSLITWAADSSDLLVG
jgi:hypothetical protein